jgi:ElaB/YqjD/DUF883 family membrane-anchored ribosome-binding protein
MSNTRSENNEVEAKMAQEGNFGDLAEDQDGESHNLPARATRALEVGSDYLRGHDIEDMRNDLEREIRAHPIKSIAIALGAGYLIGKLFK